MILSILLQIILAIVLVLILLLIAYLVFEKETVYNSISLKRVTTVFDGIIDFSNIQASYDTLNKYASSYRNLSPSVNQNGGAEYSYNFWIYMDKNKLVSDVKSSDIVLFLRGNKKVYKYTNDANCQLSNIGKYILVKNPLVRIKSDGSALIVEYNTLTNPDSYRENGKNKINCNTKDWNDKNKGLLGIYNMDNSIFDKKWFMISIILKEITPTDDIFNKNKTSCKIYINGINMLERIVESPYNGSTEGSTTMKHNSAPLYVNPGDIFGDTPDRNPISPELSSTLMLADLKYYNYELTEKELSSLYSSGFTKETAKLPSNNGSTLDPYQISPNMLNGNNMPIPF